MQNQVQTSIAPVAVPLSLYQSALVDTFRSYSGQIAALETEKVLSLKKTAPAGLTVQKMSRFQVRIGVAYENKQAVKDIRAEGREAVPLSAKGWEFVEFPFLVRSLKNGKLALACSSVLNGNHSREFYLNGLLVAPESLSEFCYAADLTSGDSPLWFTVYLENIRSIC